MKIKLTQYFSVLIVVLPLILTACSSSSPSPEWLSDTTPPVVTPPAPVVVAAVDEDGAPSTAAAIKTFLASAVARDNLEGQVAVSHNAPVIFPFGKTTTVTFSAKDGIGNIGTATSTITVVDLTAPVINVAANITVAAIDATGTPITQAAIASFLATAQAADNIDVSLMLSHDAPVQLPIGSTDITFSATDQAGNTGTATATITVADLDAPVFVSVPADITVAAIDATGTPKTQADIAAFLSDALATDNIDVSLTLSHDASDQLPIGSTNITFSATDDAGNTGTATATITVADQSAPVITAPVEKVFIAPDSSGIAITDPNVAAFFTDTVTASDDVDATIAVTNNAPSKLPVGLTSVVFNAVDAAGNAALSVTTNITVVLSSSNLTKIVNYQTVTTGSSGSHVLAIDTLGQLWSWGDNQRGQLGHGTLISSAEPVLVPVPGLTVDDTVAIKVAAGINHSLVLLSDNSLWAWGDNSNGQLGDGNAVDSPVTLPQAVDISGLPLGETVTDIVAGDNYNLALLTDGSIWGWGYNINGQLGNGKDYNALLPKAVVNTGLPAKAEFVAMAAGTNHSLALLADGSLWAWGYNYNGQLGNGLQGNIDPNITPQSVIMDQFPVSEKVAAISAGNNHSLVLLTDGTVWSWGNNEFGQLGHGNKASVAMPKKVSNLPALANALVSGANHNLVKMSDGSYWGWGDNSYRQINRTLSNMILSPVSVAGLPDGLTSLAAGENNSFALDNVGKLWAWGSNLAGQLGDGRDLIESDAILVTPTSVGIVDLNVGKNHALATSADGSVYSWGWNNHGQHGNGTNFFPGSTPGLVENTLALPLDIAAGGEHSLAVLQDGTVMAWGSNEYGQVDDAVLAPEFLIPRSYPGLPAPASQVTAGLLHSMALLTDGGIWSWGYNFSGQLGDGSSVDNYSGRVIGLPAGVAITSVAAGDEFSVALMGDGTVWTWGGNWLGQLGDGLDINANSAVQVIGLTGDVVQVAVGSNHVLALKQDGTVQAWGDNRHGQVGNNSYITSAVAVDVLGLPDPLNNPVTAVAAGANHSLAMLEDGSIIGWGDNRFAQLGSAVGELSAPLPTALDALPAAPAELSAGESVTMVLAQDGQIYAWGDNSKGLLGNGRLLYSEYPRVVLPNVGYYVASGNSVIKTNEILKGYQHPNSLTISLTAYDTLSANGGVVNYNSDGTFSYTPPVDYVGTDTFLYTVSGQGIDVLQQVVTIEVLQ